MKQLLDLRLKERFGVPEEEVESKLKERLMLMDEEVKKVASKVFVVVGKYCDECIRVGDTSTAEKIREMEKHEFPGDLVVIPF